MRTWFAFYIFLTMFYLVRSDLERNSKSLLVSNIMNQLSKENVKCLYYVVDQKSNMIRDFSVPVIMMKKSIPKYVYKLDNLHEKQMIRSFLDIRVYQNAFTFS